ncbi:hypothetical protein SAMN04487861_10880 [Selenomonas ruminantium]|uniref:PD-(D/E)XK nuclease superfamily protein n=1 Tax=Selenomonas ruminantium TaxID=971 RepID=A0A1I3DZV0_SELRU|nr:hypothetical protein [Selenomonas ruminantium]SFH92173.1 hypothetical protein SAMN04487861_10880 [Selenomonas ruminantium]
MESIFDKLLKARCNSNEDYLTELLALTLKQIDGIAIEYIRFICQKGNINLQDEINLLPEDFVETQKRVSTGIIDLILKTDKDIVFISEHKWWNGKLLDNQIMNYMNCTNELRFNHAYSVLITPSRTQWTQHADIQLTWSDIYEFFKSQIKKYQNQEKFLIEHFILFLENNGMGKYNSITPEALYGFFNAAKLEKNLKIIFSELESIDWLNECPALNELIKWNGSGFNIVTKKEWGRLGIDFMSEWKPGLFAGVILDTDDHQIEPEKRENGPDFVILLDVDCKDDSIYNSLLTSLEYQSLSDNLSKDSKSFTFIPHNKLMNKWRLAVLKKPLVDILLSKYDYDEQKDAIKGTITEGINLIVNSIQNTDKRFDTAENMDNIGNL